MKEKWKHWQILFSWAPKSLWIMTAAMKFKDTCSLEGKLDRILESRDITLLTKVHIVKAVVFPVVMYGCETWTIQKAECWRTDAFELWYWRRLLRARISNQSILKEINPEYTLEGLTMKLQYFGYLSFNLLATWFEELTHWKRPWCWKDWRQKENEKTECEMLGWLLWHNGHEFEQT